MTNPIFPDVLRSSAALLALSVTTASLPLGCSSPGATAGDPSSTDSEALTTAAPATEASACPATRWVGETQVVAPGVCPAPGAVPAGAHASWVATPLFGAAAAPGLARFCSYAWTPDGTGTPAAPAAYVGALPPEGQNAPTAWLGRDCHSATPLAAGDPGGPVRRDRTRAILRQVDAVPVAAKPTGRTRIALVDTSPETGAEAPAVGLSGHGFALTFLAQNVACPRSDAGGLLSNGCGVRVLPYLGMPLTEGDVPHASGGTYGRQSDVAIAIARAVDQYHASNPATSGERLVVNLSLGWEPRWTTWSMGGERPAARAVRAALTHAYCHGALSIAAAGNDPGGPTPATGAMYPAAWEDVPAPDVSECETFEGGPDYQKALPQPLFIAANYRPLVYAAGGVDGADRAIAVARANSTPRLVAPASQAPGRVPAGTKITTSTGGQSTATAYGTDVLTGTSVAAALVSATAAQVWAMRPELTAPDVIDLVYAGAVPLGTTASVCNGCSAASAGHPEVHRLDACKAIAMACEATTASCHGTPLPCASRAALTPDAPALTAETVAILDAEFAALPALSEALPPASAIVWTEPACGAYWLPAIAGAAQRCPSRQLFETTAEPWVGPQPGFPECPSCRFSVTSTGTVRVYLSLATYSSTLTAPTLRLTYSTGATLDVDISKSVPVLRAGTPVALTLTGIPSAGSVTSAALVAGTKSTVSGRTTAVTVPLLTTGLAGRRFRLRRAALACGRQFACGGLISPAAGLRHGLWRGAAQANFACGEPRSRPSAELFRLRRSETLWRSGGPSVGRGHVLRASQLGTAPGRGRASDKQVPADMPPPPGRPYGDCEIVYGAERVADRTLADEAPRFIQSGAIGSIALPASPLPVHPIIIPRRAAAGWDMPSTGGGGGPVV